VGLDHAESGVSFLDLTECDESLGSEELVEPSEEIHVDWLEFCHDLLISEVGEISSGGQLVDLLGEFSSKRSGREGDDVVFDSSNVLLISLEPHHDLFGGFHLEVLPG